MGPDPMAPYCKGCHVSLHDCDDELKAGGYCGGCGDVRHFIERITALERDHADLTKWRDEVLAANRALMISVGTIRRTVLDNDDIPPHDADTVRRACDAIKASIEKVQP